MRQEQALGQIFKSEYIDSLGLLSKNYNKTELDILSTEENRTIQSGISFMYGLYPLGTGQKLDLVDKLD